MTKQTKEDIERQQGLAEWRRENWKRILTSVEGYLSGVMGNQTNSTRDRNEAARTLARMADILTPEKVAAPSAAKDKQRAWSLLDEDLTPEEKEEIDRIIGSPEGPQPEVLP
jgi:hypothetical protein